MGVPNLKPYLPTDPAEVLDLSPDEIAELILPALQKQRVAGNIGPKWAGPHRFRLDEFSLAASGDNAAPQYQFPAHRGDVAQALMEAFSWMEREGLIARFSEDDGGNSWYFLTRKGHATKTSEDWNELRQTRALPPNLLHPTIRKAVWSNFLRGEYDVAVFSAMRQVEVAVRRAGEFDDTVIGTDLMRKAFGVDKPLSDRTAPASEQEALGHLFAGTIGSYKNPHSHRHVQLQPKEAAEIIVLASHLLGIVETREGAEANV